MKTESKTDILGSSRWSTELSSLYNIRRLELGKNQVLNFTFVIPSPPPFSLPVCSASFTQLYQRSVADEFELWNE